MPILTTAKEAMDTNAIQTVLAGSPETVANETERWIRSAISTGSTCSYAVTPNNIQSLVGTVVPELQKRGRVWHEYEGDTLREYIAGPGNARFTSTRPGSKVARGATD